MSVIAAFSFFISLALVVTGVLILAKNHKSFLNLTFFASSVFLGLWIITNYYSNDLSLSEPVALLTNHLVLLFSGAALIFLTLFSMKMAWRSLPGWWHFFFFFTVFATLLSLTPFVVEDIVPQEGVYAIEFGVLAPVYFVSLFVSAGITFWSLISGYFQASGIHRARIGIIIWSFGLTILFAFITNVVVPLAAGVFTLTNFGPLSVALLVAGMAYVIVQHRLFDIRLVIARTFAYVLAVFTLVLVYGYFVFGFVDQFFPDTSTTALQQALYTLSAVFLALTFQPLKHFFDRFTSSIFYRDRYSSEDVINRLGRVFVAKGNSFELLDESLRIITETLKVEFGRFVVLDGNKAYRSAHEGIYEDEELAVDDLLDFNEQITLLDEPGRVDDKNTLTAVNVYAVVRMATRDELIGYLVLGAKRSGTIYTQQDINLLEILAQELAVAVDNAKSYEEIQAFSETLKKEVDEATAKLRETNKRLVKLDEAKDEFISMASHQLRTPLTTIKGYLSMLLDGDAGKLAKKQEDFIDMAFVSSQRMVHLISDMLNVSRISTGRLTIDKARFDLVDIVESELSQLQRQAEAHGVKLKFDKPDKPVEVELDENKIRQVIMNFSDNAMYYSPEGEVNVSVKEGNGTVEFQVKDNGIGVSKEAQKQLFTKFFRAENAQAVRPDGTGLGLYMAKQVVEAQGGEIIFSSKEGKGSTFGFRFQLEDK